MVSLLNEETSEIGKKRFAGCYEHWQKDGIFAVTNIGVEILIYIQIFILVKAALFLAEIYWSSLIINKWAKTGILMKITKKMVITASSLWAKY